MFKGFWETILLKCFWNTFEKILNYSFHVLNVFGVFVNYLQFGVKAFPEYFKTFSQSACGVLSKFFQTTSIQLQKSVGSVCLICLQTGFQISTKMFSNSLQNPKIVFLDYLEPILKVVMKCFRIILRSFRNKFVMCSEYLMILYMISFKSRENIKKFVMINRKNWLETVNDETCKLIKMEFWREINKNRLEEKLIFP